MVIPLLDAYPEEMKSVPERDLFTFMFIEVLFIVAKIQKQPTCPSTYEQIKENVIHIHTHTHTHTHTHRGMLFTLIKEGNLVVCN